MPPRDPYEIKLSEKKKKEFVDLIIEELDDARSARSELDEEAKYWMQLYEQRPTRPAQSMPWPDAADLTSWIGTEKVDALHARLLRTIFTEPICTVEGWGEAAARAQIVEEFHQWKAEEERLQSVVDRALLLSLIEPMGIHEVTEGVEKRWVREQVTATLASDPMTGGPMLDETGQPVLERDADGKIATVEEAGPGTADVVVDRDQPIRIGPVHKVVPFRDFYPMPGHARDRSEVWGYAKRFYRRQPQLEAKAKEGFYDKAAVERIPASGEHAADEMDSRSGITVINTDRERSSEKELWEFLVLWDFGDGTGERWYVATVHYESRELLRVQHDDLGASRYVLYVPIPRPDSIYGYSLIGDKLITPIVEHTAWRNMNADKAMMAVSAPIQRRVGSLWDPDEQPIGPNQVLDVRTHDELQPLQFPDLPHGAVNREHEAVQAAERLAGVNDTATGQTAASGTTLGEVQLVAQQSFVRMDTMIHRIQEGIEDLFQVRHLIWQRELARRGTPESVPAAMLTGLEHRGVQVPLDGVTAEMLTGAFRFKPRGSVESADLGRKRSDLVQFVQFLAQLAQAVPMVAQKFQDPGVFNALMEEAIRVFDFENRQAFLGSAANGPGGVPGADPGAQLQQIMGQMLGGGPRGIVGGGVPAQLPNPVMSADDVG